MIVAFAGLRSSAAQDALAANLAVLRARQGRKICVLDTDARRTAYSWGCARGLAGVRPAIPARAVAARSLSQEIEGMQHRYADILISTGDGDSQDCRSALIAARVVVVPIEPGQVDLDTHYQLVARLNAARMFNPGLRVLFVIVGPASAPSERAAAAIRTYVAHVMSATLAKTVVHVAPACVYGQGRCVCDAETCDPQAAADMHALYNEVFPK
jgi:chromosome partitioning protein